MRNHYYHGAERSERRNLLFIKIYHVKGGSAGKINNLSGQNAERAQLIQVIQTTLEFTFRAPAAIARAGFHRSA